MMAREVASLNAGACLSTGEASYRRLKLRRIDFRKATRNMAWLWQRYACIWLENNPSELSYAMTQSANEQATLLAQTALRPR